MIEFLQTLMPPPFYAASLAVTALLLTIGLVSVMPHLMSWCLRRLAPAWVASATKIMQAAILLIGLGFMMGILGTAIFTTLLVLLLPVVLAAASLPNNVVSDGLATVRIRTFGYYRPGDWVTVGKGIHGAVVAIDPFSTLLKTPTQEHQVVGNSTVVTSPILVHTNPLPESVIVTHALVAAAAIPVGAPTLVSISTALDQVDTDTRIPEPLVTTVTTPTLAPVSWVASVASEARVQQRPPTPLLRRPNLGKQSITLLRS